MSNATQKVHPDPSTEALMVQLAKDEQTLAEAAEKVRASEREQGRLEDRVEKLKTALGILG